MLLFHFFPYSIRFTPDTFHFYLIPIRSFIEQNPFHLPRTVPFSCGIIASFNFISIFDFFKIRFIYLDIILHLLPLDNIRSIDDFNNKCSGAERLFWSAHLRTAGSAWSLPSHQLDRDRRKRFRLNILRLNSASNTAGYSCIMITNYLFNATTHLCIKFIWILLDLDI